MSIKKNTTKILQSLLVNWMIANISLISFRGWKVVFHFKFGKKNLFLEVGQRLLLVDLMVVDVR